MKITKVVWCPFNRHYVSVTLELPPNWDAMDEVQLAEAVRIEATVVDPPGRSNSIQSSEYREGQNPYRDEENSVDCCQGESSGEPR